MEEQNLKFQVQNIPGGESTVGVALKNGYLEIENTRLSEAVVHIQFLKSDHFIQVEFAVKAELEMICDRSLEPFIKQISGSYKILFNVDVKDIIIDEKSAVKPIPESLILNIDEEVRDTIMLNIPVKKIHPKYLDKNGFIKDFETKQFGDVSESGEDQIDPRWEKLKKLKSNN